MLVVATSAIRLLACLVALASLPLAQELAPEVVAQARRIAAIAPSEHAPPPRTVDVLHYALHVDVDPEQRRIAGRAQLELRPAGAARRAIQLDADGLAIETVVDAAGQPLAFAHKETSLEIELGRDVPPEESLQITITYSATPRRGLIFVAAPDGSCAMVWSQGECSMSSAWFPCRDYPDDRASSELFVTLPDAWKSVSNGVLIESTPVATATPADPHRRTDHWRMDFPHPAYLTSMALGPFVEIDLGRVRDLPLLAYATADRQAAAAHSLQPTGAMVELLEKFAGLPYPYPAYRQVCVAGFPWSGMENVAATTLAQDDLVAPDRAAEGMEEAHALVVHELAHQWFGDLVTCAAWGDLWLNEGFASFAEGAWLEAQGEPGAAAAGWAAMQAKFVELRTKAGAGGGRPIVSSTCVEEDDLFDATIYEGGASFLHLLRDVVGPAKFAAGVTAWIARFRGRSVGTDDFERTFEEVAGPGLTELFQEWLHAPGVPAIEFSWSFDPATKRLELSAQQKQAGDGVPEVYHVPVQVAWQSGATRRETRMQLDARRCRVAIECDERPKFVRFNAGGALFGTLAVTQAPAEWREQLALESDPLGRVEAAAALAEAWAGFKAPDDPERRLTLASLARALIEDPIVAVRVAAAEALGKVAGEVARTALGCALWDDDRRVRAASAEALGNFKSDEVAAGLLARRFGVEPTDGVRAAALAALADVAGAQAVPTLAQLVDNERVPPEVRGAALLAAVDVEGLEPALVAIAADRAVKLSAAGTARALRLAAIEALGKLAGRSDSACDALTRLLDDPELPILANALEALDDDGVPLRVLPALVAFHGKATFPDHRSSARKLIAKLVPKLPP